MRKRERLTQNRGELKWIKDYIEQWIEYIDCYFEFGNIKIQWFHNDETTGKHLN